MMILIVMFLFIVAAWFAYETVHQIDLHDEFKAEHEEAVEFRKQEPEKPVESKKRVES